MNKKFLLIGGIALSVIATATIAYFMFRKKGNGAGVAAEPVQGTLAWYRKYFPEQLKTLDMLYALKTEVKSKNV